jgi:formate-dependent nitrite reductase membrane component NrfD
MAEHFAASPSWTWYILGYFFLGGVTGGTYAIATALRLWGAPEDERVARMGYLIAFPVLLVCPILLTLDLGKPLRFWHMLVSTTPGAGGLMFKAVSPMSVGSWALTLYGIFAFLSFIEALLAVANRPVHVPRPWLLAFDCVGAVLGLFVASYTGVLLAVSNQPIWSDSWTLGGLFLASGLTGSAALLAALAYYFRAADTEGRLERADGLFAVLELAWLIFLIVEVGIAGTLSRLFHGGYPALWALVALGLIASLFSLTRTRVVDLGARGSARLSYVLGWAPAVIILAGIFALRAAIIFTAQT